MMADIPWREYLERVKNEMVFLPVGATEQHGPHMPLGVDFYQIESIAKRVAEKMDAINENKGNE